MNDFASALIGAAVGGVLAIAGSVITMLITFRHERRERRDELLDQVLWRAQAAAWDLLRWNIPPRNVGQPGAETSIRDLTGAMTQAVARARKDHQVLSERLMQLLDGMRDAQQAAASADADVDARRALQAHLSALTVIVGRWTRDAEDFERHPPEVTALVRQADEGLRAMEPPDSNKPT